jgi:putative toxin-antitoxin system antitoxin component (TIGR02293 family)
MATPRRASLPAHAAGRFPEIQAYLKAVKAHRGHPYVSLLGLAAYDTARLDAAVRRGLPYGAFEKLSRALALPAGQVAETLSIPGRTLQRRKAEARLAPDESDRLVRLARLYAATLELFEGDAAAARQWLESPALGLGGETPLRLSQTEPGAREVEALIGRLEHGVFS